MSDQKKCTKCGALKPATTEHFNKKAADLASQCRPCRAASRRCDGAAKVRANDLRRAQRASDPEVVRARERAGYGDTKRKNVAAWRKANPEKVQEMGRRRYDRDRERFVTAALIWAKANPEAVRATARRLHQRRQACDPRYRINRSMRALTQQALAGRKAGAKWLSLVDYTLVDLMAHLERQFASGMTWDNYGQWHIDHILPLSGFDFDSAAHDDFKACWTITNLRPLWANENIIKRDKRLHLI